MISEAVAACAVFLDGLLAGVFLGSSLVEHAARTLSASPWLSYKQAKEAVFGPIMPGFFGTALVFSITAAMLSPALAPACAAGCLVVVLVVTIRVHVPLNALIQGWPPGEPPTGWDDARRRWRNWNWLRCALAVIAFGAVLLAAAERQSRPAAPLSLDPEQSPPHLR